MSANVLVIDDDPIVLKAVTQILKREGYRVQSVSDPIEGVLAAKSPEIDVVVSDIRMPNLSGLELLRAVKAEHAEVEIIMMTGNGSIESAVEAVKAGAFDYLTKPFEQLDELTLVVARAVERRALRRKTASLEQALEVKTEFQGMVGQSAAMTSVFRLVETLAPSSATVLIRGESGTGKELVARAIHAAGPRRNAPFVAVNCSALTETLLESELFGHMKGAFTGAVANKKGLFEAAHGGTLFLDEIGDISPGMQVRLLRALQEGEVKPVGSTASVGVDVRVIAATHVNLEEAMEKRRFREDLYYRLTVIPITLPALRERPDDVPHLAHHFLRKMAERHHKKVSGISRDALEQLMRYRWPGNVRELQHAIERAVILTPNPQLEVADLPEVIRQLNRSLSESDVQTVLARLPFTQAKEAMVNAFERRYLTTVLERTHGNVTQAALAAGMDRSNFRRLVKAHGLGKAEDGDGPELS